jgi:hypothetical protein
MTQEAKAPDMEKLMFQHIGTAPMDHRIERLCKLIWVGAEAIIYDTLQENSVEYVKKVQLKLVNGYALCWRMITAASWAVPLRICTSLRYFQSQKRATVPIWILLHGHGSFYPVLPVLDGWQY